MNCKHQIIPVFTIFIILTVGCGNRDTTLLDNLEVRPIVNPNVGVLMGNNDLYASMIDDQTIIGYGNDFVFQTNDFFENFAISNQHELAYFRGKWNTLWVSQESLIGYERNEYENEITIKKTFDHGVTWKKLIANNLEDDISRGIRIEDVIVLTENTAIIITDHWSYLTSSNTLIFMANIDNGIIQRIGQIEGYAPVKIKMIDDNVGFISLRSHLGNNAINAINTFVSRTQDGGRTWSDPLEVSDIERYSNLEAVNSNTIIVYDPIPYISRDSGESWSRISIGFIMDFFTLEDKIFAVERSGEVYRSDDDGLSWTFLGKADVLFGMDEMEISFYDEDTGIIFQSDQLFYTDDGGYSWSKLIYPYGYTRD